MEEQELPEWNCRSSFSPLGVRIVIIMSSLPIMLLLLFVVRLLFFPCLLLLSLLNVECILAVFETSINIECRSGR